jgi:hypothetical protein
MQNFVDTVSAANNQTLLFNRRKAILQEIALVVGQGGGPEKDKCFENFGKVLCHFLLSPPPRKKFPRVQVFTHKPEAGAPFIPSIRPCPDCLQEGEEDVTYGPLCDLSFGEHRLEFLSEGSSPEEEREKSTTLICNELGFAKGNVSKIRIDACQPKLLADDVWNSCSSIRDPGGGDAERVKCPSSSSFRQKPPDPSGQAACEDPSQLSVLAVTCEEPLPSPFICNEDLRRFVASLDSECALNQRDLHLNSTMGHGAMNAIFHFMTSVGWEGTMAMMDLQYWQETETFGSSAGCLRLDDMFFDEATAFRSDLIACPYPFVKNANMAAFPGTPYCVGQCPSPLSLESHGLLWHFYVAGGLIALGINLAASIFHGLDRLTNAPTLNRADHVTHLLLFISVTSGVLGPLFLAVFGENLLCMCPDGAPPSELCVREDIVGALSRMSTYALLANLLGLSLKFSRLLKMISTASPEVDFFDDWKPTQLIWVIPLLLALVAWSCEPHNSDTGAQGLNASYLARTGFIPHARFTSFPMEFALLHLPMFACAVAFAYYSVSSLRIFNRILTQSHKNITASLQTVPQFRKMLFIGAVALLLLVVWLTLSVATVHLLETLPNDLSGWMDVCRGEVAIRAAQHDLAEEISSQSVSRSLNDSCGDVLAKYRADVGMLQTLQVVFETTITFMIAASFGLTYLWKVRLPKLVATIKSGTVIAVVPASAGFDGYDNVSTRKLCLGARNS